MDGLGGALGDEGKALLYGGPGAEGSTCMAEEELEGKEPCLKEGNGGRTRGKKR